jgi:signal peptidase II
MDMIEKAARWSGRSLLLLAILGTIGCDRVTKHVATATLAGTAGDSYLADTVWVGYVENPGGFLSLGASLPPVARTIVFTVGTGVMLLLLAVIAARHASGRWSTLGLALFVAGGASNWIDRIVRGSVVDFVSIGIGPLRTGVFNMADVAIMVGALMLVVGGLHVRRDSSSTAG